MRQTKSNRTDHQFENFIIKNSVESIDLAVESTNNFLLKFYLA